MACPPVHPPHNFVGLLNFHMTESRMLRYLLGRQALAACILDCHPRSQSRCCFCSHCTKISCRKSSPEGWLNQSRTYGGRRTQTSPAESRTLYLPLKLEFDQVHHWIQLLLFAEPFALPSFSLQAWSYNSFSLQTREVSLGYFLRR
jgi:hypothetical protein